VAAGGFGEAAEVDALNEQDVDTPLHFARPGAIVRAHQRQLSERLNISSDKAPKVSIPLDDEPASRTARSPMPQQRIANSCFGEPTRNFLSITSSKFGCSSVKLGVRALDRSAALGVDSSP
jgi:hypothetical protein